MCAPHVTSDDGTPGLWSFGALRSVRRLMRLLSACPSVHWLGSGARTLPPLSTVPGQLSPVGLWECKHVARLTPSRLVDTARGMGGDCGQGASTPIAQRSRKNCGAVTKPPEASRSTNTSAQGTQRAPTRMQRGGGGQKLWKIAENCRPQFPPPPSPRLRSTAQSRWQDRRGRAVGCRCSAVLYRPGNRQSKRGIASCERCI